MKKSTFEEYLKSKVKTANKGYLKSIEEFNEGFKNDKYLHHDSNPEEVKILLDLRKGWDYKGKEISNFKSYLIKIFPFLNEVDNLEDLSIKNLKKLSSGMQSKNSDPLLRAISQSYSSGNLSAVIGLLIEYKKLIIEVSQEDRKDLNFKRNRIIYGAPGTGKSYLLNKEVKNYFENLIIEREIEEIEEIVEDNKYWVVGAKWGDKDQTERFIKNSIWENGYSDKYLDRVKEIKNGDYIGIKSSFTRKKSDGNFISVLRIKALGVVKKNYEDGRKLDVEWLNIEEKDYDEISYRLTIHEVQERHHFIFNSIKKESKSVFIEKQEINSLERVTFYDGYTHGQFVGSYKPFPEEKGITYKYIPGPFFRQLIAAYRYPEHDFCLIIEEINRARADRVFGNIFQLLDRDEEGNSRYKIALSEEQKEFIYKELCQENETSIRESLSYDGTYIPKNLYIWATMNSADQGVYHLDTAFKRRWNFEHIGLNENMDEFENDEKDYIIFYQRNNDNLWDSVSWNDFREVINDALMNIGIHEDRLIAPFFIGKSDFGRFEDIDYGEAETLNNLNDEVYVNKVLMYLFDDVLKYKKNDNPIFSDYKSFSKLKEGYDEDNSIFNNEILKKLDQKSLKKGFNTTFKSLEN